ncbi:MAG: large subunit ribosomal protein L7/L12 [Chloroflexi bacterium]|nr:MAG: large subunit ribosomal protein L7/L12 [Chloroflexota bacterium]
MEKFKEKLVGKEEIIEAIKSLTVLELSEVVKALEEEFGVSAAAPVAVAAPAAPAASADGGGASDDEEQTEFQVVLKETGAEKISVIKAVREVTTLGLREAKELVEGAPATVREGIGKEEADEILKKLQAAGATVVIE